MKKSGNNLGLESAVSTPLKVFGAQFKHSPICMADVVLSTQTSMFSALCVKDALSMMLQSQLKRGDNIMSDLLKYLATATPKQISFCMKVFSAQVRSLITANSKEQKRVYATQAILVR